MELAILSAAAICIHAVRAVAGNGPHQLGFRFIIRKLNPFLFFLTFILNERDL